MVWAQLLGCLFVGLKIFQESEGNLVWIVLLFVVWVASAVLLCHVAWSDVWRLALSPELALCRLGHHSPGLIIIFVQLFFVNHEETLLSRPLPNLVGHVSGEPLASLSLLLNSIIDAASLRSWAQFWEIITRRLLSWGIVQLRRFIVLKDSANFLVLVKAIVLVVLRGDILAAK